MFKGRSSASRRSVGRMETEGTQTLGECGLERPHGYQPPGVDQVLTPADLEREVLYAGLVDGSGDPG
jgi:hypothetical protein